MQPAVKINYSQYLVNRAASCVASSRTRTRFQGGLAASKGNFCSTCRKIRFSISLDSNAGLRSGCLARCPSHVHKPRSSLAEKKHILNALVWQVFLVVIPIEPTHGGQRNVRDLSATSYRRRLENTCFFYDSSMTKQSFFKYPR